jgi:uncharacterized membrane protein YdbT with pleckstrin-like domain
MKFPSKKDIWLEIIFWVSMIVSLASACIAFITGKTSFGESIFLFIFTIVLPIILIWLWFTTYYVLDNKELVIRSGPYKKRISLEKIISVKKTLNPLSSPALSLKRIEITYEKYGMALISPKDREQFIKMLKERCPHVIIKN